MGRVDGGPAAVYILGMKRNNVKVPPENFSKFSDWRGLNAAPLKEGVLGIVKIFIGSIWCTLAACHPPLRAVWPDLAIYWTLCTFLKH